MKTLVALAFFAVLTCYRFLPICYRFLPICYRFLPILLQIFAYLATDFCLSCYRFIKYVAYYDKICRDICESLENKGVNRI